MHELIQISTHLSENGAGYWCLSEKELASMFGINVRFLSHPTFDAFLFTLVQIMDSLLMQSIMDSSSTTTSKNTMLQLQAIDTEYNITLSLDIGKGMRNFWFQMKKASQSATKADNAVTAMKL